MSEEKSKMMFGNQNENLKKNKSKNNKSKKQSYKYEKKFSILNGLEDKYKPTAKEWEILYTFYVTYSMVGGQSYKKKNFKDYGWEGESVTNSGAELLLEKILPLKKSDSFIFTDKDDLKENYKKLNLEYPCTNFDYERVVIGRTTGSAKYDKLFYRIRDCLAHGCFVFQYNSKEEVMLIMEDHGPHNVTARIVIKLNTLLDMAKVINKNNIFVNYKDEQLQENLVNSKNHADDRELVTS